MTGQAPRSVLLVALRRLGDVLLTTPLIRSMRRAWPQARIDALVFEGTEGILEGNPDLARVIAIPPKPSPGETIALLRRLWRAYDLAVSTQPGDRPTLFAFAAGRRRAGPFEITGRGSSLKRLVLDVPVLPRDGLTHRVDETLRLADALGVARVPEVVAPRGHVPDGIAALGRYAVIHAAPMFRYKRWTEAGWRALAGGLRTRGLSIVASGGPGAGERAYLDAVFGADPGIVRADGRLSWPDLAETLRRAALYVGPDTSVTHLAAATGVPTVALFGPTDPRQWGPWPEGGLAEPWLAASAAPQRRGNVVVVQNPQPCTPCRNEGCERRIDSYARCLDEMTPAQVLAAVDRALA